MDRDVADWSEDRIKSLLQQINTLQDEVQGLTRELAEARRREQCERRVETDGGESEQDVDVVLGRNGKLAHQLYRCLL